MKRRILVLLLVLSLALLSLSAGVLSSFSSVTLDGDTVDESFFKDHRVTMVNVWATYCSPCIREMPDLEKLSQNYKDKSFQILGIIIDVNESNLFQNRQLKKKAASIIDDTTKVTYTNILTSKSIVSTGLPYSITSVPTTFFVDETGSLIGYAYAGIQSYDEWAKIVDELLEAN